MVITRFAPSPTGFLHIGGVRAALYPYLLVKHEGGRFILRYEDTDQKRLVKEGYDMILQGLQTFGILPDETFRQSDRLPIYKEYADKLIASGAAYYCFATAAEIDQARKDADINKVPFRFRSPYRDLALAEAQKRVNEGGEYTIRLKLPEAETIDFTDEIQGKMQFNTKDVDEGVLLKSDGFPTYHLAYIVDDFLMGVTHVFRGVEWLPSVPKHILLYRALNIPMPKIYHMPLILDPEGGKLSKRKGAVAVHDFINQGYLPEAILNFIGLLGWTPNVERIFGEKEREFFSMQDMIDLFDLSGLNKSSPVFNREKLIWFNQKYIQNLLTDELQKRFVEWTQAVHYDDPEFMAAIVEKGPDFLNKILELEKTRIKLLAELPEAVKFYYIHKGDVNFSEIKQTKDFTAEQIQKIFAEFATEIDTKAEHLENWPHEDWEAYVRSLAEKMDLKAGAVFMLLRLAVADSQFSPPLYEIMQILGKKEVIARLRSYV